MIKSLDLVGTIYSNTAAEKIAAKRAVLSHDANATDILEILGLDVTHGDCQCCPDDGRYDGK